MASVIGATGDANGVAKPTVAPSCCRLSNNAKGAMLIIAHQATFCCNDALMKVASPHTSMFQALFIRGLMVSSFLTVVAWWRGDLEVGVPARDRQVLVGRVLCEIASTVSFLTALFRVPMANVSAILGAVPLAILPGGALLLGEPIAKSGCALVVVGFFGVLLVTRPGLEGFNEFSLVALLAVFFGTLRDLAARSLSRETPSVVVALASAVSITALGGGAWVATGRQHAATRREIMEWAGAAGFLQAAYLCSVMSMRVGDSGFVQPFRYSGVVFAILLGTLVLREALDVWTVVGAAVIVGTGLSAVITASSSPRPALSCDPTCGSTVAAVRRNASNKAAPHPSARRYGRCDAGDIVVADVDGCWDEVEVDCSSPNGDAPRTRLDSM